MPIPIKRQKKPVKNNGDDESYVYELDSDTNR